jgi:hypothetical protein
VGEDLVPLFVDDGGSGSQAERASRSSRRGGVLEHAGQPLYGHPSPRVMLVGWIGRTTLKNEGK